MAELGGRTGCCLMQQDRTMPFRMHLAIPELLEFTGEFGAEINSFVPFIYWLHLAGQMRERRIRTYHGMRPFYFFLDPAQIEEKSQPRHYVPMHRCLTPAFTSAAARGATVY